MNIIWFWREIEITDIFAETKNRRLELVRKRVFFIF